MANQQIICEHCDCVYEKVTLAKHQKALCVRCSGVLQRYNGLSVQQRLALTVTAISIIIAPVFQLLLLIWVLSYALAGRRSPAFKLCMRWLEALRPWSMLEVCLLGAMVAVFKLAGMLDVIPGTGLFALAALSLLLIRIAGRDVRDLWDTV